MVEEKPSGSHESQEYCEWDDTRLDKMNSFTNSLMRGVNLVLQLEKVEKQAQEEDEEEKAKDEGKKKKKKPKRKA